MVDESLLSSNASNKRRNMLSTSSCGETCAEEYDDNEINVDDVKMENQINSIYDVSTSSPESENNFNFNMMKTNNDEKANSDKKVHWNPSQVHALLDCIEKRIGEFKRKSVHKSVWVGIGKEMSEHGDFSVEHCYNKWKNLRRDIRLYANSNTMQKLSIRNTFIMERVQKMVSVIGYESSLSRKSSSSPISPNMMDSDPAHDNHNNSSSNEDRNDDHKPTINPDNNSLINEDTIVSLLADPAVSQAILMNPKMIEEIVPGIDIVNLLQKIVEKRPDLVASLSNQPPLASNNSATAITNSVPIDVSRQMYHKPNPHPHSVTLENAMHRHLSHSTNNNNFPNIPNSDALFNTINNHNSNNNSLTNNSWPHQLYELLHSFRDEESRQMQRLDQIVNYVHVMQDSTKRRLNTINQLLSLAGLLIPQK